MVIVGEANNGVDAIRLIQEMSPEIIFLDVQMPGLSGLEVLGQLDEVPLVIFSTAYDKYALEAFEHHAVDYLLKPYTRERFKTAIHRLFARLQRPQQGVMNLAQQMVEQNSGDYPAKILAPKGNKLVALDVNDILRIAAEGDYSLIVTQDGQQYLSQFGIGQLEKKLSPKQFFRIHRSSIINIDLIKEIFKEGHGYDIRMKNGDVVHVSRSYAAKVKELIF